METQYGKPVMQGQEGKDVSVPLTTITQVLSDHVTKSSQNQHEQHLLSAFAKSLLERIKQTNPNIDEKKFISDAGLTNIGQRAA